MHQRLFARDPPDADVQEASNDGPIDEENRRPEPRRHRTPVTSDEERGTRKVKVGLCRTSSLVTRYSSLIFYLSSPPPDRPWMRATSGRNIAMTMNPTAPPRKTIITGSMAEVSEARAASTSCS